MNSDATAQAIAFILGEQTSRLIVLGTFLIVGGIVLVAWKPDEQIARLIGGFISEALQSGPRLDAAPDLDLYQGRLIGNPAVGEKLCRQSSWVREAQ
jgi:hypothetical protein